MNINFEPEKNININAHSHQVQNNHSNEKTIASETMASAFALSVGNNNMSFGNQLDRPEGMDEWDSKMAATDVQMKQDYMSVMSLSMSDEDYKELVRTGEVPRDMDATDAVTILDDIKAAVIKGGTQVAGFTDDIDMEALKEITGSVVSAESLVSNLQEQDVSINPKNVKAAVEAIELALGVLPIADDTVQYMLENKQAPTIDNLYMASHSKLMNGAGYKGSSMTEDQMNALMPQIENLVNKSGIENNESALADAKWMVERNIPLTLNNLYRLEDLRSLQQNVSIEAIEKSVAIAMSAGIPAGEANLSYSESIYTQAELYDDELTTISDQVADAVVDKGLELNIRNLVQENARISSEEQLKTQAVNKEAKENDLSIEQIHARRVLEEVRITMTVQANRMLLRNNFYIDITPMEELVDALKQAESSLAKMLFPNDSDEVALGKAHEYQQAKQELATIPSLPVSILSGKGEAGEFAFASSKSFTLHQVYETGSVRRELYIQASQSYEAIMTAPRSDMGDSIRKAFRNVDAILEDMQLDISDQNQRAVRILGYNQIEITEQNIEMVKAADGALRRALDRLSPGRVLGMIRENVNPLNMSVDELNNYLDGKEDEPQRQAENYARFLMQLERQDEITELERDSYIGIYRMIAKLDKSDDAAIGRLVEMGQTTSFASLLQAMRSMQHAPMDYQIGDEFGGIEGARVSPAIDDQINAAFIENLLSTGAPVSFSNLEAMEALRSNRGDWFKPLKDKENENTESSLVESAVDSLLDKMIDADSVSEAYESMLDSFESAMSDMVLDMDSILDVRAMQNSMKQISVLRGLSRNETYEVPVTIAGESTSIRLTMKREAGAGQLQIAMESETTGRIAAQFDFRGTASGYVAYENADSYESLSLVVASISEELSFAPELIKVDRLDLDKYGMLGISKENTEGSIKNEGQSADISNTELYRISKLFIEAVRSL